MFKLLLRTPNEFAMTLVRVGLGASLLPHGLVKLGVLEGGSPEQTVKMVESLELGLPGWTAYLLIATEVLFAGFLILGFLGRLSALSIGIAMAVAAWTMGGLSQGEYLTWWVDSPMAPWKTTYGSYHLLAICCALAILIRGSGALSIDRLLARPKSAL